MTLLKCIKLQVGFLDNDLFERRNYGESLLICWSIFIKMKDRYSVPGTRYNFFVFSHISIEPGTFLKLGKTSTVTVSLNLLYLVLYLCDYL